MKTSGIGRSPLVAKSVCYGYVCQFALRLQAARYDSVLHSDYKGDVHNLFHRVGPSPTQNHNQESFSTVAPCMSTLFDEIDISEPFRIPATAFGLWILCLLVAWTGSIVFLVKQLIYRTAIFQHLMDFKTKLNASKLFAKHQFREHRKKNNHGGQQSSQWECQQPCHVLRLHPDGRGHFTKQTCWKHSPKEDFQVCTIGSRAPSQYKDRLIYIWWFPC